MPKDASQPVTPSSHAHMGAGKDDVMSLLAEFENSVADLKRMAGQGPDMRSEQHGSFRAEPAQPKISESDRIQNAAIRTELEELRTTLSRRALEMDQRAFDLERRRREMENEADQLRKAVNEQLSQTQVREKLVEKHESEFAVRLTQLTGQVQESDRSRVLAEEKLKATELARSQAEARAKELETQLTASAGGNSDVERKLLELSNRIAQAEAELVERRRKSALDAELLAVAEQKRLEAESKSEASRQHLWSVERELGETRDRVSRMTSENACDIHVQQAIVESKARVNELEREVWLRQQEVDRARDERAQALKDAERASELAAKAEAVAQHTVAAVESLKNQITTRTAELESERAALVKIVESLKAELESARNSASPQDTKAIAAMQAKLEEREREFSQNLNELSAVSESERSARVQAEAAVNQLRDQMQELVSQAQEANSRASELSEQLSQVREDAKQQIQSVIESTRKEVESQTAKEVESRLAAQFDDLLQRELASRLGQEVQEQLRAAAEQAAQRHAAELARVNAEHQAQCDAIAAELQAEHAREVESASAQLTEWKQRAESQVLARKELETQHQELASRLAALDSELQLAHSMQVSTQDAHSNELKALRQQIAELQEGIESARRESRASESSALKLMETQEQSTAALTLARQEIVDLRASLQTESELRAKADCRADEIAKELHQASTRSAELAEQVSKGDQQLQMEAEQAASQIALLRDEQSRLIVTNQTLEQQLAQQTAAIAALKSSTNDGQAQAARAEEARHAAERALAEACDALAEANARCEREQEAARANTERLQRECETLRAQSEKSQQEWNATTERSGLELQNMQKQLVDATSTAHQREAELAELRARLGQIQADLQSQRDAALADVERLRSQQTESGQETQDLIDSLRSDAHSEKQRCDELSKQLEIVRSQSADSTSAWQVKVDQLTTALAAASAVTDREEEVSSLRQELQLAKDQSAELEATIAKLADRLRAEVQQRRQLEERSNSASSSQGSEGGLNENRQQRMRLHRRLRRQQMEQIREAGEVLRKRFEICEQVLSQRAQLAAAHQVIQETQKKQASQRAVGRAAMVMGHGTIVLAILAGLSWAVAGQISPGRFAARATLEADGKGRELATEELKEWQKFHEDMLNDPQFATKVSEHMKRFAMGPLADAGAVAERLKTDMSFESARPGVLTVELRGDGPDRTARELNAITTKLAAEAVEARARRIDGAVTIIAKEAAADPTPIDSKRLQVAGMILGGCAAFGVFVATFIYRRLAAAKQKFERDIALEAILDAARWPNATERREDNNAAPMKKAA